jgi:pSer/pThr/pTyr-binding forkhead associated (FHA) protein
MSFPGEMDARTRRGPAARAVVPLPNMTAHLPRFCVRIEHGDAPRKELITGEDRVVIGRSPEADLVVEDEGVSLLHCEIARDQEGFVLRDLGSEKGTWLSGVRVREVVLPSEAYIELGASGLSFGAVGEGDEVPRSTRDTTPRQPVSIDVPFKSAKAKIVSGFELEYLTAILAAHNGNITASANAAQLDRVHFLRLLDRYGLRKTKVTSRPPKSG